MFVVKSMTGYGRGEAADEGVQVTCELRSVNHRFAEVVTRVSREYIRFEDVMKRIILSHLSRGRIDAYLTVDRTGHVAQAVRVDTALAAELKQTVEQLAEDLQIDGTITVSELLAFPQMVTVQEKGVDAALLERLIAASVEHAALDLVTMRAREGERLAVDFRERLGRLELLVNDMEHRSPHVTQEYREKLLLRIRDVMQPTQVFDEARVLMEVALMADRVSVDEELVRLRSHIEQFQGLLTAEEPVGRKLDFLVQEMNREVNTVGSKANDLLLSRYVVEAKSLLEQIREQVQNVE